MRDKERTIYYAETVIVKIGIWLYKINIKPTKLNNRYIYVVFIVFNKNLWWILAKIKILNIE